MTGMVGKVLISRHPTPLLWMTVLSISKTASLPGFQLYMLGHLEIREWRVNPSTLWGSPHHLPFDPNQVKGSSEMKLSEWVAVQCLLDCSVSHELQCHFHR